EALLRLHVGAIVKIRVVGAAVAARVQRVALEVPGAVAWAAAGVAVEEAVLLARVHVVARQPGGEGVLAVVTRRDALRVGLVDLAVAVVVDAIAAGVDLALALQRHAGPAAAGLGLRDRLGGRRGGGRRLSAGHHHAAGRAAGALGAGGA